LFRAKRGCLTLNKIECLKDPFTFKGKRVIGKQKKYNPKVENNG
jgi:hypothetical protein